MFKLSSIVYEARFNILLESPLESDSSIDFLKRNQNMNFESLRNYILSQVVTSLVGCT
jgi:hypothetical protein